MARREIAEALDWYRERSARASEVFLDEVESGIERAAESPLRWPAYELDSRRLVLNRVPFSIVYRLSSSVVEILAVAHHSRRPGYWHDR